MSANQSNKTSQIDRVLGFIYSAILIIFVIVAIMVGFRWWLVILISVPIGVWIKSGWQNVPIGSEGQFTLFNERIDYFVGEGDHWGPKPFGIKSTDCRKQTMELETLETTTKDDVPVKVGGTVSYRIDDIHIHADVKPDDLEKWIKATRERLVRTKIRTMEQEELLGAHLELGNEIASELSSRANEWGVEILEVIIPAITPDPEVAKDLASKEREILQRKGQQIEIGHFAKMVKLLMEGGVLGEGVDQVIVPGGLSREQAVEHVQLVIGKSTKAVDAKTISADEATIKAIAAIFGRK